MSDHAATAKSGFPTPDRADRCIAGVVAEVKFRSNVRARKHTLICWFGGKARLANRIIHHIPADHTIYCEPFGGAASVLLNKPRSKVEVYNDVNEGLFALFRVLADEQLFGRLYARLLLQRYGRSTFDHMLRRWQCSEDLIERAMAFYIMARQSFGGNTGTWGYTRTPHSSGQGEQRAVSFLRNLDALPSIHERTDGVVVECNDWRKVMAAYDTPETIYYCDPPYVPETRRGGEYHHEMTRDDHEELVERLLAIEGRALLSGYDSDVYQPLEAAGWRRIEWQYTSSAAGNTRTTKPTKEQKQRLECLWVHPGIKHKG